MQTVKYFFLVAVCLIFGPGLYCAGFASESVSRNEYYFAHLRKQLTADGFNARQIQTLYSSPSVYFDTKGVSSYFVYREGKLNYDQFLADEPIQNAKIYLETHKNAMLRAEQGFGVSRYAIAAILLVETRLGTYVGSKSVFNILSTMAALSDPKVRNILWQAVSAESRLSVEEYAEKARKKSGWAYQELKAFLRYTAKEGLNPLEIIGSFAGAMGYCQFMPSNISLYAKDGNGDGRIDLFTHPDAIMSIASYLNHYGWHSGITREQAYKVVYNYNRSRYYVETVLKIIEMLRS
ncbi:MAG: lytic murein transglycosylase [Desulfococcaceae bacterium]